MIDMRTYRRMHRLRRDSDSIRSGCSISDTKTYDKRPLELELGSRLDEALMPLLQKDIQGFEMRTKKWGR